MITQWRISSIALRNFQRLLFFSKSSCPCHVVILSTWNANLKICVYYTIFISYSSSIHQHPTPHHPPLNHQTRKLYCMLHIKFANKTIRLFLLTAGKHILVMVKWVVVVGGMCIWAMKGLFVSHLWFPFVEGNVFLMEIRVFLLEIES